jgi:prepilin-type N-terminal cleavage/methylation domain-containing protein
VTRVGGRACPERIRTGRRPRESVSAMVKAWVKRNKRGAGRSHRGWTLAELLAVILLAAVLMLIATLSVYRGKAAADELACQDNMRAIHSALEIYWTKHKDSVTGEHIYPANQAAFEQFLQDRAYFSDGEPRCPLDDDREYHYHYSYDPVTNPGPEGITITCPVPDSGHGSG